MKALAVIAGLLALLTYLLMQGNSPDAGLSARSHEALQQFALHDEQLGRDMLLARAGMLSNYDSLAGDAQEVAHDLDALQAAGQSASNAQARALLQQHLQPLAQAVENKLRIAEHFKSDNALLRNSLVYLTHAQSTLRARVDASVSLGADSAQLSHALLGFVQSPGAEIGREIASVLDRMAAAAAPDAEVQSLVTHGRFVVSLLPRVDALMREAMAVPTAAHAQALQEAVLRHAESVETRAQVYRLLLYAAAVLLLGYLSLQFVRLRAAAQQLRISNSHLGREITQRQQAAVALQASEERLRAISESAREAIVTADRAGRIVAWNPGASALFGYAAQEMIGLPFTQLMAPRLRAALQRDYEQWLTTGRSARLEGTIEIPGLRKDGSECALELSLASWSRHDALHVTGIMRDVSERKRLEETARQQELQLIQANKMTALGTLVSGVAHEINNPNQLVLLNARLLADAWDDALDLLDAQAERGTGFTLAGLPYAEMRHNLPALARDMHDGALRIQRIVNDLKDFARPPGPATQASFELNEAVERALRLLAHLIAKRSTRFEVTLGAGLPSVRGDAAQAEQVIVNLVVNALEALPGPDRGVQVCTREDAAHDAVLLEVHDEGVGIPRKDLERLCDPFFTTKQASGGTGLGLAISASLLRAQGAQLRFESEPARGTRAIVTFKRFNGVAGPAAAADVSASAATR